MGKSAFIFPGQGAQYVGMGKELYDASSIAKDIYNKASEILGFDIARLCFEGTAEELNSTKNSQPAILVTSIAAFRTFSFSKKDIKADSCAGLSLGEYSALVASEALTFDDAVKLVRMRGEFMEDASIEFPGTMAAIMGLDVVSAEEIARETGSEVANLNSPGQIVISGTLEAVKRAMELAKSRGALRSVPLKVSGPFHSSLMTGASDKLRQELQKTRVNTPKIPFISNVTADYVTDPDTIKENLALQVNHRTLWEDTIKRMQAGEIGEYYEIGPGKVLKGILRKIDKNLNVINIEKPAEIYI